MTTRTILTHTHPGTQPAAVPLFWVLIALMWVCHCAQHRHRGRVLQPWELNVRDYQSCRSPLVPTCLSSPLGYSVHQGLPPPLLPPLPPLPPHSQGWDPPQIAGKPSIVIPGAPHLRSPPVHPLVTHHPLLPAPSRSFASLQLPPSSPPSRFGGSCTVPTMGSLPTRHPATATRLPTCSLPVCPLLLIHPSRWLPTSAPTPQAALQDVLLALAVRIASDPPWLSGWHGIADSGSQVRPP